jgi:diguanylate cyclase (GGDEF)-like protein
LTGLLSIALAATALGTAVLALAAMQAGRRAQRRLTESIVTSTARMSRLADELAWAIERLGRETRLAAELEKLVGAPDLADALRRTAVAAVQLAGARDAVARAVDQAGTVVVGSTSPTLDLAAATGVDWPPDGARAMSFSFLHGPPGESTSGAGLAVPIGDGNQAPVGLLVVLFGDPQPPPDEVLSTLERLAAKAAPLIAAYVEPPATDAHSLRDLLTNLPTRRAFVDALAREVARARRHAAPLALVALDIDDLRRVNADLGRASGDAVLDSLARSIEAIVPPGAMPCRIGGDEFGIVLPGSSRLEAEVILARLESDRRDRGPAVQEELTLDAGVAELTLSDDALSLFDRATRVLENAKSSRREREFRDVEGARNGT